MSVDTLVDGAKTDIAARLDKLKADLKAIAPTPTPTPTPTTNLYDDFSTIYSLAEGATSPNGKWKADFLGGGFAKADGKGLIIAPAGPTLRSAQVRSTKTWKNQRITFDVTTDKQLVTTLPQPWHCGWLLFRHIDKWRHYYIAVKTSSIEIGKKDAPVGSTDTVTETYQKFLFTGGPATTLAQKRKITLELIGSQIKLWVDGILIKTLSDTSSFDTGSVSCYAEGAQARYENVIVETL